MDINMLMIEAENARKSAYAPYSKFKVGAALLCKNGKIFKGCNIENSSFSMTMCAERIAFFKAISEGENDFSAIAVTGGNEVTECCTVPCFPCGACIQVMSDFCSEDFIICLHDGKNIKEFKLSELYPFNFKL